MAPPVSLIQVNPAAYALKGVEKEGPEKGINVAMTIAVIVRIMAVLLNFNTIGSSLNVALSKCNYFK